MKAHSSIEFRWPLGKREAWRIVRLRDTYFLAYEGSGEDLNPGRGLTDPLQKTPNLYVEIEKIGTHAIRAALELLQDPQFRDPWGKGPSAGYSEHPMSHLAEVATYDKNVRDEVEKFSKIHGPLWAPLGPPFGHSWKPIGDLPVDPAHGPSWIPVTYETNGGPQVANAMPLIHFLEEAIGMSEYLHGLQKDTAHDQGEPKLQIDTLFAMNHGLSGIKLRMTRDPTTKTNVSTFTCESLAAALWYQLWLVGDDKPLVRCKGCKELFFGKKKFHNKKCATSYFVAELRKNRRDRGGRAPAEPPIAEEPVEGL